MSPEAVELDLFIHGDYDLWKMHEAVEAMLAKKIVKGVYSPELAIKGWMNLVERAARMSTKENQLQRGFYSRPLLREVATELERRFYHKHVGMRRRAAENVIPTPDSD